MATLPKNKLEFLGLDFTGKSDLFLQGVSGENNHSELDYTDVWEGAVTYYGTLSLEEVQVRIINAQQ